MRPRTISLAGLALVTALLGAACGNNDEKGKAATSPSVAVTVPSDGGAATLRQVLTSGLQEHEYLAGIAIYAAVNTGLDSATTKAAVATLDQNSVGLSKAIGSVYGSAAEKAFLPLWRKHIGFFVDYAVGGLKKDRAAQNKARSDLDGYRADFGAFLASANPNLTKDAVADALVPHVNSTFDAIDSLVAKRADAFDKLKIAADHLPHLGQTLAGAIAKQFPDKFS
jgi:hypothetical protein